LSSLNTLVRFAVWEINYFRNQLQNSSFKIVKPESFFELFHPTIVKQISNVIIHRQIQDLLFLFARSAVPLKRRKTMISLRSLSEYALFIRWTHGVMMKQFFYCCLAPANLSINQ